MYNIICESYYKLIIYNVNIFNTYNNLLNIINLKLFILLKLIIYKYTVYVLIKFKDSKY